MGKRQVKIDAFLSSSPPHRSASRPNGRKTKDTEGTAGTLRVPLEEDEGGSQSSDAGAIHFEAPIPIVIISSEDEGGRPPRSKASRKRVKRVHSEESGSGDREEDELQRGRRAMNVLAVLDSEEEEVRLPKKRKLVKGKRPPTPEDEEENLMDEVDEYRIIQSRLRTRDKRSEFQRNLEKLKRKKRGEIVQSASEEDDDDADAPFAGARPHKGSDPMEEEDSDAEEEEMFIVEDDSTQVVDLPAEFSMVVHDPEDREEVMASLRRNEYFSVPLATARRKLSGMRDSLVAGSTWRPIFRKALDKYPDLETQQLDFAVLGCDACNLGGRKSTIQGRLSGEPYDPVTYEAVGEQEPDSADEEGHDTKKEFHLGRFCAKRTRTYHQFTHWEYHLFHTLRDEVEILRSSQDERSFVKVAYAKGRQPPEDLRDADAIMDWFDERQVINIQWQEIQTMMENARHLEVKGGRDDAESD